MLRQLLTTLILCITFSLPTQAAAILHDINGTSIPFESLKGQWVYINYWANWCDPCLAEIAELNRLYQAHKDSHVIVFAVHYDPVSKSEQQKFSQQFGIQYPVLREDPADVLGLGDINSVPTTFVFNPEGKLIAELRGPQTYQQLDILRK